MDSKKADELGNIGIGGDDREVMAKKSITTADLKDAVSDGSLGLGAIAGESVLKTVAVIVFSLLLIAGGIFFAVFTGYTIIGLIVGIIMIIAAIAIPFKGLGRLGEFVSSTCFSGCLNRYNERTR